MKLSNSLLVVLVLCVTINGNRISIALGRFSCHKAKFEGKVSLETTQTLSVEQFNCVNTKARTCKHIYETGKFQAVLSDETAPLIISSDDQSGKKKSQHLSDIRGDGDESFDFTLELPHGDLTDIIELKFLTNSSKEICSISVPETVRNLAKDNGGGTALLPPTQSEVTFKLAKKLSLGRFKAENCPLQKGITSNNIKANDMQSIIISDLRCKDEEFDENGCRSYFDEVALVGIQNGQFNDLEFQHPNAASCARGIEPKSSPTTFYLPKEKELKDLDAIGLVRDSKIICAVNFTAAMKKKFRRLKVPHGYRCQKEIKDHTQCPELVVSLATVDYTNYQHISSVATFKCKHGAYFTTASAPRRCMEDTTWSGHDVHCTKPNGCAPNPCKNEATCIKKRHDEGFTCKCSTHYSGKLCAEPVCSIGDITGYNSDCSSTNLCTFQCAKGFVGSPLVECTEENDFIYNLSGCKPEDPNKVQCDLEDNRIRIEFGRVEYDLNRNALVYSCLNDDDELFAPDSEIICNLQTKKWSSYDVPQCVESAEARIASANSGSLVESYFVSIGVVSMLTAIYHTL